MVSKREPRAEVVGVTVGVAEHAAAALEGALRSELTRIQSYAPGRDQWIEVVGVDHSVTYVPQTTAGGGTFFASAVITFNVVTEDQMEKMKERVSGVQLPKDLGVPRDNGPQQPTGIPVLDAGIL